jgi:hypothetical protein
MGKRDQVLDFLFELNSDLAAREASGKPVVGPGLPPSVKDGSDFVTLDCFPLKPEG